MTARQGLWMALVGLVIGVVSVAPAYVMVISDPATGTPGGGSDTTDNLVILFFVGGFVGLVVMIVGLIMAGVATVSKGSGQ